MRRILLCRWGVMLILLLIASSLAFALETMRLLFVWFLGFGLGLDPRQQGSL